MLELRVIKHSESEYAAPVILAEVPGKDPRTVVDYRKLNALTKDQVYPIPDIEERVEPVSRAAYVTTLDLTGKYRSLSELADTRLTSHQWAAINPQ